MKDLTRIDQLGKILKDVYNGAAFIELYQGFTLDLTGIETIEYTEGEEVLGQQQKFYVNITKKGGNRINIVVTRDKNFAKTIYRKLQTIVGAKSSKDLEGTGNE